MKKKVVLVLCLFMMLFASGSFAATIDFENMPQEYWFYGGQKNFGDYWAGVFFGPQSTILEKSVYGYNYSGYPPHSGDAVLFSIALPRIRADFDNPVNNVSLWYTCGGSNFYIDAYDASDNLITSSMGGSNYGTNSFLEVNSLSSNISYVVMHDNGNYFTIDDFTAPILSGKPRDTQVPEPGTIALIGSLASGLFGFAGLRKRFTK